MTSPQTQSEPSLAKPGAGLPFFEAMVARYYVLPFVSKKQSWDEAFAAFRRETEKILKLTDGLEGGVLETRVLIPRITGIEDSSRFWSVAMALEHLMIVAPNMAFAVVELSHGRVPPVKVDVAKVKPSAGAHADIRSRFRESMTGVEVKLREVGDRASGSRLHHPWFGPIDARQWHWLLGSHQWIHRKQIEQILKRRPQAT